MNRRRVLHGIASGGALLSAGCVSIGEDPGPFNFGIVNRREQSHHVEFTLWDDADDVIIDGSVDIAPRPPGDGEYTLLDFPGLIRVTNDDEIDVGWRPPVRRSKRPTRSRATKARTPRTTCSSRFAIPEHLPPARWRWNSWEANVNHAC